MTDDNNIVGMTGDDCGKFTIDGKKFVSFSAKAH